MSAIIYGSVVDPAGIGLDNATVLLGDASALCSRDGSFQVDGVPLGEAKYRIIHRDYPVVRGTVDIAGDVTLQFSMTTPRSPPSGGDAAGIMDVKRTAEAWLLDAFESVVAVGVSTARDAILVYVHANSDEIPLLPGVPDTLGGFPVRLIPMNVPVRPPADPDHVTQERYRPVCGGVSAAHYETPAGTLGVVVLDRDTGSPMFLSNNHIFARCSSDAEQRATVGDPILQPSAMDGGTPNDTIGQLTRWVPYRVSAKNLVDAAVATPLPDIAVDQKVLSGDGLVEIRGTRAVSSPVRVKKCGRSTGCGIGEVVDWDFTTIMDYPTGESILYVDQLLIAMSADAGDSGAVILDTENRVVGLLSGTTKIDGKEYVVANKIRNVLESLDVMIPAEDAQKKDSMFGAFVVAALVGFVAMARRRAR